MKINLQHILSVSLTVTVCAGTLELQADPANNNPYTAPAQCKNLQESDRVVTLACQWANRLEETTNPKILRASLNCKEHLDEGLSYEDELDKLHKDMRNVRGKERTRMHREEVTPLNNKRVAAVDNYKICRSENMANSPVVLQGYAEKDQALDANGGLGVTLTGSVEVTVTDRQKPEPTAKKDVYGKIILPQPRQDVPQQNNTVTRKKDVHGKIIWPNQPQNTAGTGNQNNKPNPNQVPGGGGQQQPGGKQQPGGQKQAGGQKPALQAGTPKTDSTTSNSPGGGSGDGAQKVVTGKIIKAGKPNLPDDKQYEYGKPDPIFAFADGFTRGIAKCYEGNLPGLALAPLAEKVRALRGILAGMSVATSAGGMWEAYEQYRDGWPEASDYQRGVIFGQELCQSVGLIQGVRSVKTTAFEARVSNTPTSLRAARGQFTTPSALNRGLTLQQHKGLSAFAAQNKKIVMVRDSNRASMRWFGQDGYKPKPASIKGKTIPVNPNKPLSAQPNAGLASAKGLPRSEVAKLKEAGYSIEGRDKLIVDGAGNKFYSDTDLHGVYNSDGTNGWRPALRSRINEAVGDPIVKHGPHDDWNLRNQPGPNAGPQPPVTAYTPDGRTWHMQTVDDMKLFYQLNGIEWKSVYPGY